MLKDVLQSIEGIAIYPFVGLIIFVCAFLVVVVLTWRMRNSDIDYASRLPLDTSAADTISGERVRTDDRAGGTL